VCFLKDFLLSGFQAFIILDINLRENKKTLIIMENCFADVLYSTERKELADLCVGNTSMKYKMNTACRKDTINS
jgi:hypothetical protein